IERSCSDRLVRSGADREVPVSRGGAAQFVVEGLFDVPQLLRDFTADEDGNIGRDRRVAILICRASNQALNRHALETWMASVQVCKHVGQVVSLRHEVPLSTAVSRSVI